MTITNDQATEILTLAYRQCKPGSGSTFLHMLLMVEALLGLRDEASFELTAKLFKPEHAAFERDLERIFNPHADRMSLRFGDASLN